MIVAHGPLSVSQWRERLEGAPDGATVVMPREALVALLALIEAAESSADESRRQRELRTLDEARAAATRYWGAGAT